MRRLHVNLDRADFDAALARLAPFDKLREPRARVEGLRVRP
jgi:hypothetical protein